MKLSRLLFSFSFAILLYPSLQAQNIDSLRTLLNTIQGDGKVKTYNELFRAYLHSSPVTAVGYAREALMLADEIGDKRGMAAAYNNLGVAYRNQGALDKALEYYLTSLSLYDSLDNNEGVATSKNNIATIYAIKKDYKQAMRYLEESYSLFEEINDPFRLVGSMNNLGNLYQDIEDYEKALKYYTEAFELSEKNGASFADPLTNIGNLYFNRSEFEAALGYYSRALEIERSNNNKLGVLNILTNMGITYTKAGRPGTADRYLNEALALSEELQSFTNLPTIYKAMAENYSLQNRWKEAFEMQVRYDESREKIYSEESSRNIAQMEMVLAFQQKERELEILRKDDEIKTLELRTTRLVIILAILAVIVVIGCINYFYLDRRRKLV
jgi:tetratricopeptide (TPR) repeat protein